MANEVKVAPVDNYPERPSKEALKSDKDTVLAEGRVGAVDQIPDYHKKHKTLDASGPQYDQAQAEQVVAAAQPKPKAADVKAAADNLGV